MVVQSQNNFSPDLTREPARIVDRALDRALEACLRGTRVADDPLVRRRLALPIRFMGGGLRRKEDVRLAAYAGSLVTAVKQFSSRQARDGSTMPGFFPSLAPSLGGVTYSNNAELLGHYLASGAPAATALARAWEEMQAEVSDCSKGGPLSESITGRAAHVGAHLQREITKHRELAAAEKLHEEMKGLMTWRLL